MTTLTTDLFHLCTTGDTLAIFLPKEESLLFAVLDKDDRKKAAAKLRQMAKELECR